jgi:hypothetical protein
MSEARLWKTTRDAVGHIGHWDRIESHSASQGRFDVNACIEGDTFDIELKIYDSKRGGFVLRASQNAWACNRVRAGGNAWIFARYDGAQEEFLLIPAKNSRALIHDRSYEGWAKQAVKIWYGKPQWQEFLRIVRSGTATDKASPN